MLNANESEPEREEVEAEVNLQEDALKALKPRMDLEDAASDYNQKHLWKRNKQTTRNDQRTHLYIGKRSEGAVIANSLRMRGSAKRGRHIFIGK